MILTIYSKVGVVLYETDNFKYTGSFMGDRTISLTAESPSTIAFLPDDYVDFRGERYVLDLIPAAKKISSSGSIGNALSYDLIFYPYQIELKKCDFLDVIMGGNNLHYTGLSKVEFTGDIHQLASRIQANLNRLYPTLWGVTVIDNHPDVKPISLTDMKCWDALLQSQSVFGFNFTVKNRLITINSLGTLYEHVFEYGQGNGLYSINGVIKNDDPVITRLRCYGSTENLPANYKKGEGTQVPPAQFIPSLMLPDYETTLIDYIDSENISIYGIREGIFRDETIKPTIKGMTGEDIINKGGETTSRGPVDQILSTTQIVTETQTTFKVEIPDLSFMLSNYAIPGVSPMLEITDGVLGGRAFEIVGSVKSTNGYTLTLNRNNDDANLTLPNISTSLSVGNHFVFTGLLMPDLYVKVAEGRLYDLGVASLADNDHSKFAYGLGVDEAYMMSSDIKDSILEGDELQIFDSNVGVNGPIIIQQLNITYGELLPKYEITLSDKPLITALDLVRKGIAESSKEISSTILNIDKSNRSTQITIGNIIDNAKESRRDYRFVELPDRIRTIFTTLAEYIEGTVELWFNGVAQIKGVNYFEDDGKIRLVIAIPSTCTIKINYLVWTGK